MMDDANLKQAPDFTVIIMGLDAQGNTAFFKEKQALLAEEYRGLFAK